MESGRKLKAFLALTVIFATVILIDWYGKINYVRVITEDDDITLSSVVANNTVGNKYNSNKTYFWRKEVKKTEQNGLVPFTYRVKILGESKYRLLSK